MIFCLENKIYWIRIQIKIQKKKKKRENVCFLVQSDFKNFKLFVEIRCSITIFRVNVKKTTNFKIKVKNKIKTFLL